MKILLWHGYLLGGTGSNVYTRALAREWSNAGHDVTVVCQERQPELYDVGSARVTRPELPGGLLPVFVLDGYPGLEARLLQDFTEGDCRRLRRGQRRCAPRAAAGRPRLHEPCLARRASRRSARRAFPGQGARLRGTEYSMRGRPRLQAWGRETLARAEVTFVGSQHIREVLEDVVGPVGRVVEVPPGVDVDQFVPAGRADALAALLAEARRDPPNPGNANERLPDEGNAERLAAFLAGAEPTVVYFGKLIANKGVHLLLEALETVDARAVVVGFGDYREELERLASKLEPGRVLFTGPLEHRHLVHLLPLADAAVVPSIFPEAFGMVAAEAAAAGCPPIVARHSGLAEVAAGLEEAYPARFRHSASFETGDVGDLRAKLRVLLSLSPADRAELTIAGRQAVLERWSWASVAERLLDGVGGDEH